MVKHKVVGLMISVLQKRIKCCPIANLLSFPVAARSPVFSHLSSSLQGLWTIRALKAEDRFQKLFDAHQDLHSGL